MWGGTSGVNMIGSSEPRIRSVREALAARKIGGESPRGVEDERYAD